VRRYECNRLINLLNQRGEVVNRILRTQDIQFERIAQMQVEIDRLKRFWTIARRSELLSAPPTCSSDRGRTRWTASVLVALR